MSLKTHPIATDTTGRDIIGFQAAYLADRFAMPLEDARSFVERFGATRAGLNKAVREHLMHRSAFGASNAAPRAIADALPSGGGRRSARAPGGPQ
jgi:hypothetical protein